MRVAYARVSTKDQDLSVQLEQLTAAGAEKVFSEKQSGRSTAKRDELARALEFVREGDILLVTRLDRIARSVLDLHQIMKLLEEKGVAFQCILQPTIETVTPQGRLMVTLLGAFAEFETDLRADRQAEGIARARAAGVYAARAPKVESRIEARARQIVELRMLGLGATAIGRRLGCNKTTVYRTVPDGWEKPGVCENQLPQ